MGFLCCPKKSSTTFHRKDATNDLLLFTNHSLIHHLSLPVIVTMATICTSRNLSSADAFEVKLWITSRKRLKSEDTVVLCPRPGHSQPISGNAFCIEGCVGEVVGAVDFQNVERIRSSSGCAMTDVYTGLGSPVWLVTTCWGCGLPDR